MLKRAFDLTVALCTILLLLPVFLLIGVFIRIQSAGPVYYRGIRMGINGNPFRIFKFRTMVVDAEKMGGASTALNDFRLTKIGKFLRKYKIDELPQLINILKGDMSIVGPRPQVEKYTKHYNDEEQIMLSVRPGLTDYASIKFVNLDIILGNNAVDEKYFKEIEPEKNKLRIKYAREHSFLVDLKIIFMTIKQMLKIKVLWNTKN